MFNRITLNTALQMFSRMLELACGIAVNSALARHWGSMAFGQTGFISGIAGLCSFLFDMGLGMLLTRTIARDRRRARHFVANGLLALFPLACLGTAAVVAIGVAAASSALLPALLLASLLMVLAAATQILRSAFYAFERMELESLAVVIDRLAYFGAGLWLAFQPPNLVALFGLLAACKALNLAVCGLLYRLTIVPGSENPQPRLEEQAALLRQGVPFGLNLAFSTVYVSVDIVLLQALVGGEEVGHYRAASMLIVPLTLLAVSLNNAVFPRMSAALAQGKQAVARYASLGARVVTAAGIPLAVFLALFAPAIVGLLYGPLYGATVPLLQLLAFVIPLRFLNSSLATSLTACDKQTWRTACAGTAAAANLALNVVFIDRWHALGACISTLLTDGLIVLLLWLALRRALGRDRFKAPAAFKSLAISGLIVAPLFFLNVPLPAAAAVLALGYPLLMVRAGVFTPVELRVLARRTDG